MYIESGAFSRINKWDIPDDISIRSVCGLKGWGADFVGNHKMGFFVPKHGIQLALHNGQLSVEGNLLKHADEKHGKREQGNPNSGIGRSSGRTILGVFLFLFGASLLKITFYLLDSSKNPTRLRLYAWGIGFLAFILVGQGTLLALGGNWLS